MTYFKATPGFAVTFPGTDIYYTPLLWDEMEKCKWGIPYAYADEDKIADHLDACQASEDVHRQIGRLTRQIGEDMVCTYIWGGYNQAPTTSTIVDSRIFNELKIRIPNHNVTEIESVYHLAASNSDVAVITAATTGSPTDARIDECHSFVADAYARVYRMIITYYDYNPKTGEYSDKTVDSKNDKYLHINWGWGGLWDGYYLVGLLEPGRGVNTVTPDTSEPTLLNPNNRYSQILSCIGIK